MGKEWSTPGRQEPEASREEGDAGDAGPDPETDSEQSPGQRSG